MISFTNIARALFRLDSFNNWIKLLSVLLCLAYTLSLGALSLWFFDLFRHFMVQYVLLAVVFGLIAALRKIWPYALLMLALAGVCSFEVLIRLDYVSPPASAEALAGDGLLKVIVYNRHHSLNEHKAMVDFLTAERPDIFFILEANSTHADTLKTDLKADYPHQLLKPNDNSAFGMVVASKHPFKLQWATKSHLLENFNGITNFILIVSIVPDGHKPVIFYALHAPPPTQPFLFKQRNAELTHAGELINAQHRAATDNVILLGDWNITPYSPFFGKLLSETGLKNQTTTPYFLPSWPARLPPLLQIPIDHMLFRGDMSLIEKRRGPSLGSDHQAIVAVFKLES